MPSLIYIARIRTLSEELAESLRSAGCHVQSFKSGDITQDECMLAMTPEAAEAALHPKHASTKSGTSHANVPATGSEQQPGRDAAVWDSLKSAIAKELRVDRQSPAPVASVAESVAMELTSNAKEAASGDSNPQKRVNQRQTGIEPPPIVTVAPEAASTEPKYIRPAMERTYRMLRNPLSTVAAVLVFALAYRGLPSIIASERTISRSTMGQALSVEPRTVQRVQRHLSPDGFVAEDFTRRVTVQASNAAARKNIDQSQKLATQKRTVMD